MKYSFKIALPILIALVLVMFLVGGCLPWPHTTPRSNAASGRVLDAKTHQPIKGAAVELNTSPNHTTYTDTNGYFYLKATRNFHWGYTPPEGEWPANKDNAMKISHPNYLPVWGVWGTNAGDIFLTPKS
ncbi:MAG TPA: hypothetical protein VFV23_13195 [Verrucomicrobiae bacterium]|nr:hypothetical protein [Verrucomicrobiae bacterium]